MSAVTLLICHLTRINNEQLKYGHLPCLSLCKTLHYVPQEGVELHNTYSIYTDLRLNWKEKTNTDTQVELFRLKHFTDTKFK